MRQINVIFKKFFLPVCIGLFALSSCVNLEHVNGYAKSSARGIECFHDVHFSFKEYCNDYQQSVVTANFKRMDINPAQVPAPDCRFFEQSDSALKVFHEVLLLYFNSLAKVSDQQLGGYKLDDAMKHFKSFKDQVKWPVTDHQISAAQSIISKVLSYSTDVYRRKIVSQKIRQTQNDIPDVIDAYATGIQALDGVRNLAFENYTQFYISPLLEQTKDPSVKVLIVKDYTEMQEQFNNKKQAINTYLSILKTIKDGYAELVRSAHQLNAKSLKKEIGKYIDDLTGLKEQLNDIKQ